MNRKPARRSRRGFTLIELMVVVGIIALLIAIAIPAFSAARKASKTTATNATINVLGLGLEQFRTDAQLGGNYPPSVRVPRLAPSPHQGRGDIGGASLLVWGLAGADLLGTPGFRVVNSPPPPAPFEWSTSMSSDTPVNPGATPNPPPGLYTLYTDGKPFYARTGPYVELSKMKLTRKLGQTGGAVAQFEIPTAKGQSLQSLCFLDSFDQPVLYYRANVGAPSMAADGTVSPDPNSGGSPNDYGGNTYTAKGVYNLRDNSNITGSGASDSVAMDFGAGVEHFAGDNARLGRVTTVNYIQNNQTNAPVPRTFQHTVWNPTVTATLRPQREDSYILLSAGPDGLFGTGDDIGNFPTNQ